MLLTSESRLRIANPQHPLARKTTGNRKRAAPKDFPGHTVPANTDGGHGAHRVENLIEHSLWVPAEVHARKMQKAAQQASVTSG